MHPCVGLSEKQGLIEREVFVFGEEEKVTKWIPSDMSKVYEVHFFLANAAILPREK